AIPHRTGRSSAGPSGPFRVGTAFGPPLTRDIRAAAITTQKTVTGGYDRARRLGLRGPAAGVGHALLYRQHRRHAAANPDPVADAEPAGDLAGHDFRPQHPTGAGSRPTTSE